MCGEQKMRTNLLVLYPGSPPRVRGTDWSASIMRSPGGITPACAGNRIFDPISGDWKRDHPRVCGEQTQVVDTWAGKVGSPPRVRGTAMFKKMNSSRTGITPACAGNSKK